MAGISIKRDATGLHVRLQGCCGNLDSDRRMYDQAFFQQVLREGGRIASRSDEEVEIIDRKGHTHRLPARACT